MPARPPLAVALALACLAAVLLAGCGADAASSGGPVSVAVTRDFGARPVVSSPPVEVRGSTPVLDVVDRVIGGREGSRTITALDGVSGDWQLFVNGVRSDDAAAARVRPGDRLWLDLPGADAAAPSSAVAGSFPEPFVHGVEGENVPTRVECSDPSGAACDTVADRLTELGVVAARGGINAGVNNETLRVLVGPWSDLRVRADNSVRAMDAGPRRSGVFARFSADGRTLEVLDAAGREAQELAAGTGLVAATRLEDRQPVWFVTGTDAAGVEAAARALDEATLTTRYALAIHDDRGIAIPAAKKG